MRIGVRVLILLTATLFMLALFSRSQSLPAQGGLAPDFTLTSQDGSPVSLKDFRGKWVVLYFYPKDFTSGCTREARNFQRDIAAYERRNSVVLGISVDSAKSHKDFCAKEGLNFRLLSDSNRKVSRAYGSLTDLGIVRFSARRTFLISPEGHVVRNFTRINPNHHSQEVLAVLDEVSKVGPPS
jgi:thioredoxin-dependent peroxiredoxin